MYTILFYLPAVLLVDSVVVWLVYASALAWYESFYSSTGAGTVVLKTGIGIAAALVLGISVRYLTRRPLLPLWFPNGWKTMNSVCIAMLLSLLGLYGYAHVIELTGSPARRDLFPLGRVLVLMTITLIIGVLYGITQKWRAVILMLPVARRTAYTHATPPPTATDAVVYHNSHVLIPLGGVMCALVIVDVACLQTLHENLVLLAFFGGGWMLFTIFNTLWFAFLANSAADATIVSEACNNNNTGEAATVSAAAIQEAETAGATRRKAS